ncbi:MAG: transcriptional regulator [Betaproteobacteria bacterium]|nr:transcriptional regulator [Betaproteobacteria bacterium]
MHILIGNPREIGQLIRAARKTAGIRQDDAAGAIGMSDVSLGHLENGAPGARLDRVLRVLRELGIEIYADVSDSVAAKYAELSHTEPKRPRSRKLAPAENT